MALQFLSNLNVQGNINLNTNQLQNAVIQGLGTDPSGIAGRIYYNSGTNKLKIYNGTDWVNVQTGTDGDTTYDLTGVGSTNGTAGVRLAGSDTTNDDVLIVGAGTVGVTRSGNTLTVTGTDSAAGTVTSVSGGTGITITGSASVTPTVNIDYTGTDNIILAASDGTAITLVATDKILFNDATDNSAKFANLSQVATYINAGAGTVTSITNAADSGTGTAITGAGTFTYTGGTNITTSVSGTTVTINTSATTNVGTVTSVTAGTGMTQSGTATINPTLNVIGGAGILSLANNIEIDYTSTGIINDANIGISITLVDADEFLFEDVSSTAGTAVKRGTLSQLKTYIGGGNTTYTLPVSAGTANSAIITLDASAGTDSKVTFNGTTNEIQVTESVGNNGSITIGLPDDVTITSDLIVGDNLTLTSGNLDVTGTGSFTGEVTVPTATANTSAINLAQANLLIAGVGIFQGSYNANTNSPVLSGASNIALNLGDYFVVSVAGNNGGYFPNLEPGDFIFANADITAASSPAVSAYTVVQADANIAGKGASDGATQKGVAGFDSASFNVSANGWVQLDKLANPYGSSVLLTGGVDAGGQTTFTVDITALFGATALAKNCKAEVVTEAGRQTVYPDITGNGTGSMDFKFIPTVADGVLDTSGYRALISIM
jgi:hypothetical protein